MAIAILDYQQVTCIIYIRICMYIYPGSVFPWIPSDFMFVYAYVYIYIYKYIIILIIYIWVCNCWSGHCYLLPCSSMQFQRFLNVSVRDGDQPFPDDQAIQVEGITLIQAPSWTRRVDSKATFRKEGMWEKMMINRTYIRIYIYT